MKLTSTQWNSGTSKLSGLVLALCTGLFAMSLGCDGDDAITPVDAGPDAAKDAATSQEASKQDVSRPNDSSIQQDTSPQQDAVVQQDTSPQQDAVVQQDASPDGASLDVAAEGAAQADGSDADATTPDAQTGDVQADVVQAITQLHQLQMCGRFDQNWDLVGDAASTGPCANSSSDTCAMARSEGWARAFSDAFGQAVGEDCRIIGMVGTLSDESFVEYSQTLVDWPLAFFGCPSRVFVGPLRYGLVPGYYRTATLFPTTADLQLLSEHYIAAIERVWAEKGSPLTTTEKQAITAALAQLAAEESLAINDTSHAFDSCPKDAGSQNVADAAAD